jgi:hypothetical protein
MDKNIYAMVELATQDEEAGSSTALTYPVLCVWYKIPYEQSRVQEDRTKEKKSVQVYSSTMHDYKSKRRIGHTA